MNKKTKLITGLGAVSTLAAATDFFLCKTLFNQTMNRKKLIKGKELGLAESNLNESQKIQRHKEIVQSKKWVQDIAIDKISIETEDNLQLVALHYPSSEHTSHRWAILLHDYGGSKEDMRPITKIFHEHGFHVLTPDARAHGESEGNFISLGWLEHKDLLDWISAILDIDSQAEITLYGISMGASTILMCPQDKLINVRNIVADSAYTSVYDILSWQMNQYYKMPAFPILDSMGVLVKQKMGFQIRKASALPKLEKAYIPILFLHGDQNKQVPSEMAFTLYESCNSDKELYIIENSGHKAAMYAQPQEYYHHVFSFIDNHQ